MPRIPAICQHCGLMFPSGFNVGLGVSVVVQDCQNSCPRCGDMAGVLSGYTALINGVVAFVISPRYSLDEKRLLFQTARDVGAGRLRPKEAVRDLEARIPDGGKLLREWATLGLTFIATMATVGTLLLAYQKSKGNEPLEHVATQKFEEVMCSRPQSDKRLHSSTAPWIRPVATPLPAQPSFEDSNNTTTTRSKPPNENRKTRRTRIKKERSKARKRQHH